MENGLLDSFSNSKKKYNNYSHLFEEICPLLISAGMSYEQFWDGDPGMVQYYVHAYELKKEIANEGYWLQGLYIYKAMLSVLPAIKFGSKKKIENYVEKPIPLTKEKSKEDKLSKEKAKFDRNLAFMTRFTKTFNEKLKSEKE